MRAELIEKLVDVVGEHYRHTPAKGFLLSRFGQLHRELRRELVDEFGTLGAAIEQAGVERLRILRPAGAGKGGEIVVTPDRLQPLEEEFAKRSSDVVGAQQSLQELPGSVQIAFCVRTEPDIRVALQLAPPFRYQKLASGADTPPGMYVIEDRFRRPDIDLRHATAAQKEALWSAISGWAASAGVDLASLLRDPRRGNAFARLLAAQPRAILSEMVIPGDIADLLLRHD